MTNVVFSTDSGMLSVPILTTFDLVIGTGDSATTVLGAKYSEAIELKCIGSRF